MKIIHEWEEDNDGIIYIGQSFEDGHIERHRKEGYENVITNTEQAQLELQTNIQYLVDLTEINSEEV